MSEQRAKENELPACYIVICDSIDLHERCLSLGGEGSQLYDFKHCQQKLDSIVFRAELPSVLTTNIPNLV